MAATIHDIAKIAKVAPSTVSRALNNSPTIPDTTKQRIRDIAKELNYTPNLAAKRLATQNSFNVGFLVDRENHDIVIDAFFYNIIDGCQSIILPKNYDLTICDISYFHSDDDFLRKFVYNKKTDGLIINVSMLSKKMIKQLNDLNYPYVIIGKPKEELDISWVDADNTAAGEMAAEHLLQQGYRKIGFISGTKDEHISSQRLKGYKNAMTRAGVKFGTKYVKETMGVKSDGFDSMLELMDLKNPPEAVICINNVTAFGAMEAIRSKGLSIPSDIALVTFDDYPLAPYTTPQLTALHIDTFEIGKLAGEILINKMTKSKLLNEVKIVSPRLIVRDSSIRVDEASWAKQKIKLESDVHIYSDILDK